MDAEAPNGGLHDDVKTETIRVFTMKGSVHSIATFGVDRVVGTRHCRGMVHEQNVDMLV
jgi:hypothetical protein